MLKRKTKIDHWRGVVNEDGVLLSYFVCKDEKTDEIRGHCVMTNGFSVNEKNMDEFHESEPSLEYTEEALSKMKVQELKQLARQKGIKSGQLNKQQLVRKMFTVLNRQETTMRKLLTSLENQNFSGKPDHHHFYRNNFNAVDLHDRKWYRFPFRYHVKNWRCKMILSILSDGDINMWTIVNEMKIMSYYQFRSALVKALC